MTKILLVISFLMALLSSQSVPDPTGGVQVGHTGVWQSCSQQSIPGPIDQIIGCEVLGSTGSQFPCGSNSALVGSVLRVWSHQYLSVYVPNNYFMVYVLELCPPAQCPISNLVGGPVPTVNTVCNQVFQSSPNLFWPSGYWNISNGFHPTIGYVIDIPIPNDPILNGYWITAHAGRWGFTVVDDWFVSSRYDVMLSAF